MSGACLRGLLAGSALALLAAAPAVAQETAAPAGPVIPAPVPEPPPGADLPPVETIIPAEELAEEVPPLSPEADPELQRPIESIEEFEQQLLEGEEGIAIAPTQDPAINQPLPPLEQFDVREVELAAPASEGDAVDIDYVVRLDGLEAADSLTDLDLADRFDDLSALREGDGDVANEAMLRARLEEDSMLLESLLQSEGWYDARVEASIDRSGTGDGEPLIAVLDAAPGERYRLGSIEIVSDESIPPELVDENLPLEIGDPIVAERIMAAEANLSVALPENGYPFVELGQRDVLLDPETHLGDYTLPVELGPRARFGGFATTGDLAFGPEHVETIARFERGELYDSRDVDDLRQALIATGLFETVAVEPRRTGIPAGDGTEYVTMLVTQDAGPPRTLAASAGYETDQGFRLQGSWTHRNLFPPEGALIASAVLGTGEQGASVTFRRSNFRKRDRTLQLTAEALRSDYDAFEALTGRLAGRLSYDSTPIWRKPLTWAVGAELLGTMEKVYDFDAGERDWRKFLIAGVSGQLGIDRTDSLLDPTEGFRAQALVQPEAALSDGLRPYVRSLIDGSGYYPAADNIVVAGRVRFGSIVGIDRFELAPSRRFYGGGGGSVRGFGYQQLGPRDPNGDPLGGLSIVEAAAEVRYRFGDYGVVGFVDTGQVYEDQLPGFSDLRTGIGIGARYYTNFGPLRIDVATPLDRREGESRLNVYVSIGQAF